MDNKDSVIQVSTKSIIVILVVIISLIASIFLLNKIDESRKYKQFLELNRITKESAHLQILDSLAFQFDMNDSIRKDEIREQLNLLPRDVEKINTCKLIILRDKKIHIIKSYSKNDRSVKYLPKKEDQLIHLLDNPGKGEIAEQIFGITGDEKYLWTMVKLENAYLVSKQYRY
jgi:hypothetical protein